MYTQDHNQVCMCICIVYVCVCMCVLNGVWLLMWLDIYKSIWACFSVCMCRSQRAPNPFLPLPPPHQCISPQGNSVINAQVSESGTQEDNIKMGLRNHTIMERTLDDVFLSGTNHRGGSTTSGSTTSGDRGNNNNQTVSTMEFNKLPWIPLMKLDAQGEFLFDAQIPPTLTFLLYKHMLAHPHPLTCPNSQPSPLIHFFTPIDPLEQYPFIPLNNPSSSPNNLPLSPFTIPLQPHTLPLTLPGFEPQILQGASRLIKLGRIRVIKTEVAPRWLVAQGSSSRDFCELLERLGYLLGKQFLRLSSNLIHPTITYSTHLVETFVNC